MQLTSSDTCTCIIQADVNRLKVTLESASGDVDLLLTCEWPEDILLATPAGSLPEGINKTGDTPPNLNILAVPQRLFEGSGTCYGLASPIVVQTVLWVLLLLMLQAH